MEGIDTMTRWRGRVGVVAWVWLACCALAHAQPADAQAERRALWRDAVYDARAALQAGTHGLRPQAAAPARLRALRQRVIARWVMSAQGPEFRDDLYQAFALAQALRRSDVEAELLVFRANDDGAPGWTPQRAQEWLTASERLVETHGFASLRAWLRQGFGALHLARGQAPEALREYIASYAAADAAGDGLGAAGGLLQAAVVCCVTARQPDALEKGAQYLEQGLARIDPAVYRHLALHLYSELAVVRVEQKQYAKAHAALSENARLARSLGDPMHLVPALVGLGKVARQLGRWDESVSWLNEARQTLAAVGAADAHRVAWLRATVEIHRAKALAGAHRFEDAKAALSAADAILSAMANAHDGIEYRLRWHEASAEVLSAAQEHRLAYAHLAQTRDLEKQQRDQVDRRQTEELKVRFDQQLKEADDARLQAQEQRATAQRVALLLTLALALVLLVALGVFLCQQARQKRRLAALGLRDELTGAPSRRSIVEYAQLQLHRCRPPRDHLCLALLDLDHFKAVNDAYGHDVGDDVLRAFVDACQPALRSSDRLGRFGGEEFLLVMPGADAAQAAVVFERLRRGLQAQAIPGLPMGRRISFSMGVVEVATRNASLPDLLHQLDVALYRAKQNGRDCLHVERPSGAGSGAAGRENLVPPPVVPTRQPG